MEKTRMDDWLMQRIREDDADAFRAMVDRHRRYIMAIAWQFLGSQEDADDAAQEVFVKLYQNRATYRSQGRLRSYLARITINHCLNRLRQAGRFTNLTMDQEPVYRELPDRICERAELAALLQNALQKLTLRQRLAFMMKVNGGLSYKEIATALQCTVTAVEGLIFRARQMLQQQLQPQLEQLEASHVL